MFEWDEAKDQANFEKHGLRFDEAASIFKGPILSRPDDRTAYGEPRVISIGAIGGVVVVAVVHTPRDGKIRIISARLASRRERRMYHDYLA